MPRFPLTVRATEYHIDPGSGPNLILSRPFLVVNLTSRQGRESPEALVDSGACLSVVGKALADRLSYRRVAVTADPIEVYDPATNARLPDLRRPAFDALLEWGGADGVLGEVEVELVDDRNVTHGPYTVTAKFLQHTTDFMADEFILLGTHFLQENNGTLTLVAAPWSARAAVVIP